MGWPSKAAVLMVAVAWLSPVPRGGGLEHMGNPAVSPRVGVQLIAVTTAPPLNQKVLCLQEVISGDLHGERGARHPPVCGHLPKLFEVRCRVKACSLLPSERK